MRPSFLLLFLVSLGIFYPGVDGAGNGEGGGNGGDGENAPGSGFRADCHGKDEKQWCKTSTELDRSTPTTPVLMTRENQTSPSPLDARNCTGYPPNENCSYPNHTYQDEKTTNSTSSEPSTSSTTGSTSSSSSSSTASTSTSSSSTPSTSSSTSDPTTASVSSTKPSTITTSPSTSSSSNQSSSSSSVSTSSSSTFSSSSSSSTPSSTSIFTSTEESTSTETTKTTSTSSTSETSSTTTSQPSSTSTETSTPSTTTVSTSSEPPTSSTTESTSSTTSSSTTSTSTSSSSTPSTSSSSTSAPTTTTTTHMSPGSSTSSTPSTASPNTTASGTTKNPSTTTTTNDPDLDLDLWELSSNGTGNLITVDGIPIYICTETTTTTKMTTKARSNSTAFGSSSSSTLKTSASTSTSSGSSTQSPSTRSEPAGTKQSTTSSMSTSSKVNGSTTTITTNTGPTSTLTSTTDLTATPGSSTSGSTVSSGSSTSSGSTSSGTSGSGHTSTYVSDDQADPTRTTPMTPTTSTSVSSSVSSSTFSTVTTSKTSSSPLSTGSTGSTGSSTATSSNPITIGYTASSQSSSTGTGTVTYGSKQTEPTTTTDDGSSGTVSSFTGSTFTSSSGSPESSSPSLATEITGDLPAGSSESTTPEGSSTSETTPRDPTSSESTSSQTRTSEVSSSSSETESESTFSTEDLTSWMTSSASTGSPESSTESSQTASTTASSSTMDSESTTSTSTLLESEATKLTEVSQGQPSSSSPNSSSSSRGTVTPKNRESKEKDMDHYDSFSAITANIMSTTENPGATSESEKTTGSVASSSTSSSLSFQSANTSPISPIFFTVTSGSINASSPSSITQGPGIPESSSTRNTVTNGASTSSSPVHTSNSPEGSFSTNMSLTSPRHQDSSIVTSFTPKSSTGNPGTASASPPGPAPAPGAESGFDSSPGAGTGTPPVPDAGSDSESASSTSSEVSSSSQTRGTILTTSTTATGSSLATSKDLTSSESSVDQKTSTLTSSTHSTISSSSESGSSPTSDMTTSETLTSTSRAPTTTDPLCAKQCPDGYLVGSTSCFKLTAASSKIRSYQAALSYCKTVDRQTLASLDQIKNNADIKLIQESAGLLNIDWLYANGIGSQLERFQKMAAIYSIFDQTLVSSPTVASVGISELMGNVSALCVMPQSCNTWTCNVENLFLAYGYYNNFKQSAGTLLPGATGPVTCLYGNHKTYTVTCNQLGAIYPNPTNMDCQESDTEREITDTTNETVASCDVCFGRGTKDCQEVSDGGLVAYRCVCEEHYSMSSCWRTKNECNSTVCGSNGVCISQLGDLSCSCNWGYTGERCEQRLAEKYNKNVGYSSAVGATITVGGVLFRAAKLGVMGFSISTGEDDPQDTHQRLRSYSMLGAGIIMTLYSNPTLFAILPAACRFFFVAIHFCYLLAMSQWLMEAWNVNQVLRAVHLNEWQVNWQRENAFGVRIAPRMTVIAIGLAAYLLITFQTGWNRLAAEWTCVGVICQQTLNIWIPMFAFATIIALFAGAIYESSTLIKRRRPLLAYRIDLRIERHMGHEEGRRVDKVRNNELLSLIGLLLLIVQWIFMILSSDHRDEPIYGLVTLLTAGIYSTFCAYQELITCPEDRAKLYTLLQRFAPNYFAPEYNPETLWTIDEVREHFKKPKAERQAELEDFMSQNHHLHMHHKWDVRLNEALAENPGMSVNDALIKVYTEEMRGLAARGGTIWQKEEIQDCFAIYMSTVPHVDSRDDGILQGRLEIVTLAAEDPVQGVKLAKFFIVPKHHTFEPEPRGSRATLKEKAESRHMMNQMEEDICNLGRQEAQNQAVFFNSIVHFSHYGNHVVR